MMFEERTYRSKFNSSRFSGFEVQHRETDLWIGIDSDSFSDEVASVALEKIKILRNK